MSFFKKKKQNKDITEIQNKKRVYIELQTSDDIKEFTDICNGVAADVSLNGVDTNGVHWHTNAKSLMCNVAIASVINNKEKLDDAKIISKADWNTIYVECDEDIYGLLRKFAK